MIDDQLVLWLHLSFPWFSFANSFLLILNGLHISYLIIVVDLLDVGIDK